MIRIRTAGLAVMLLAATPARSATNEFRGVNWADPGDNFQSGVIHIAGLSSSDTYTSASAVANAVIGQFVSKLGTNSVRLPINEATVSSYWSTYTGIIDVALTQGTVILCFWSNAHGAKPANMTSFWNMWSTVVSKYGTNPNAYFEIYNEPNAYSKADLGALYSNWLTMFPSVPRGRVILDGTGLAQNVPDIGSDSRFDGCLLAVHEYSMFGNSTWTTQAQWTSHFDGEVGSYADRTVCTEWGGPMSPGTKNGTSYGPQDYDSPPGSYFVAYVRATTDQLRAWKMGSFFWAGLKDGDWYSMTTKSGSGGSITLTVSNQSGLDRMQYSWGPPTASGGAGGAAGGSSAGGSSARAGAPGSGGASQTGGAAGTGSSSGTASAAGGPSAGGVGGVGGPSVGMGGGTGGTSGPSGDPGSVGGTGAGGVPNIGTAGELSTDSGGTSHTGVSGAKDASGCSCATRSGPGRSGVILMLFAAASFLQRRIRRLQ